MNILFQLTHLFETPRIYISDVSYEYIILVDFVFWDTLKVQLNQQVILGISYEGIIPIDSYFFEAPRINA